MNLDCIVGRSQAFAPSAQVRLLCFAFFVTGSDIDVGFEMPESTYSRLFLLFESRLWARLVLGFANNLMGFFSMHGKRRAKIGLSS